MPDVVVIKGERGLPYSKWLMAQSLSASGMAPDRAYELAREIEARLGGGTIEVSALGELAAEVVREHEGDDAVRRFRDWQRRQSRRDVREHGSLYADRRSRPPGMKPGYEWIPDP